MAIVNTHYGFCAKGGVLPQFTYTGNYNMRDDGVVELLTSGTLVFLEPALIDIFCVGGGGAGSRCYAYNIKAGGGGGGGYTTTAKKQSVNGQYSITVGNGAAYPTTSRGETTSFGNLVSAEGGYSGDTLYSNSKQIGKGYNGGSGGGGGTAKNSDGGTGGSDGNDGEQGGNAGGLGGKGQGNTTREFGETGGKLYSGGGGGGRYLYEAKILSMGGAGGGGNGGWLKDKTNKTDATAGVANTGGGGGGGASTNDESVKGASGGSGIVCFRAAK